MTEFEEQLLKELSKTNGFLARLTVAVEAMIGPKSQPVITKAVNDVRAEIEQRISQARQAVETTNTNQLGLEKRGPKFPK
jgi:hypothetical protein